MRVLVVEDYRPIRVAVQEGLEEAGFAVDVAEDGESGLWMAQTNPYDALVLDLMLPKLDGAAVMRQLRQGGSKVPILLLTAKDTVEDRVAGLDLGADDYLTKPFAFTELVARVRALIRRSYDAPDPVVRISDVEIDTARRLVLRRGETIALSAREYALLEYLALRAGQLVTRTQIWEHVYDFHSEARSNVVDVYVGYLRKKLGAPPIIHTRRGQGYVLAAEED